MSAAAPPPATDAVGLLIQRWRVLALTAVVGLGLSQLYVLVAPKWYAARLSVVPSQRSQDAASMSLAAKLPIAIDTLSTDVQRIQAVLTSYSVADEVIEKFGLDRRYGKDYREQTRRALWEHCTTTVDRKSSVVSLVCEDTDPQQAMDLAAYFGEVGNRVFGRVTASSAREERTFLEAQVTKARQDVDASSQKLRAFQEQHKVVDLPEQSKAVISAMASLEGELISKQLELSYLSSFSARTESNVVQLQQQIGIMESKLKQLEDSQKLAVVGAGSGSGVAAGSGSASFFPGAMKVPELRFELEQLMREQKITETVFFLLTQRYEMARVDEARDTSTFQILDHPTLPSYPARPRRKQLAAVGTMAGLAAGAALIVLPPWWRRRRRTAV